WVPEVAESAFAWPGFVSLKEVRVTALRQVTLSADWHVIARAGGMPWMAWRVTKRADGSRQTWLWMASEISKETNWWALPSFVMFVSEMRSRAVGGEEVTSSGGMAWQRVAGEDTPEEVRSPLDLTAAFGTAGILLLVAAVTWFWMRGRG